MKPIFPTILFIECPDVALSDLKRGSNLTNNGWVIDCDRPTDNAYSANCGTATWYGWKHGPEGSISATLKGSGKVTVSFGNCYSQGGVKATLNGKLIRQANAYQIIDTSFDYSSGDVLKLEEVGYSIIKLYSITFQC